MNDLLSHMDEKKKNPLQLYNTLKDNNSILHFTYINNQNIFINLTYRI